MIFNNLESAINTLNANKEHPLKDTSIDISHIYMDHNGAIKLAEALKTNKTITSIKLRNNPIEDAGAKAIAEALEKNTIITSLDLCNDRIGNEGAKKLAKALQTNYTLTSLNLWNNNIGNEGARAIAEALQTNYTLTSIVLEANYISLYLHVEINALIKRNIKAHHDRLYAKARNMVGQKENPEAVLLELKTALTFAEQINDEASIDEFKQHISLYETLASLQKLGIYGMHRWNTIIEGALQLDLNLLDKDPPNPSYHVQAAIQQARKATDSSVNSSAMVIEMYNTLIQLKSPQSKEAFEDLTKDLEMIDKIMQKKSLQ